MKAHSKKIFAITFLCSVGLIEGAYSSQTIFSDSREEIIKEFGSDETKSGDDSFLSGNFLEAYQAYSEYFQNFIPVTFDQEVEAVKVLWKRAYCLQELEESEQSLYDFYSIEEIAKDEGYDPGAYLDEEFGIRKAHDNTHFSNLIMLTTNDLEVEDPEEPSKEEKWEAIRKGQRYLLDEGKEYVKEKWQKWKRRAKVAWKFIKQKHREYRDQNAE